MNSSNKLKVTFIRHGKTFGNLQHRYVGRTDEELCDEGINEILQNKFDKKYKLAESPEAIFISPMKRCVQTAQIIFGETAQFNIVEDLREYDFGEYEMKNHDELMSFDSYVNWLAGGGKYEMPAGEGMDSFKERIIKAFDLTIKKSCEAGLENIVYVVHGGTIMSIFEKYDSEKKSYYDYMIKNSECYNAIWDGKNLYRNSKIKE